MVLTATLLLILVAIFLTLPIAHRISRPVRELTSAAQAMERGDLDQETVARLKATTDRNEISVLTQVFGRMAEEVRGREEKLRQQLETFRIEIDEAKRGRQVTEITETDYFRSLQQRARSMRNRSDDE